MRIRLGAGTRDGFGRRIAMALTLAALAASSPRTAGANPAVFYLDAGAGGMLLPRATADVRIVSEYLEFVEDAQTVDTLPEPFYVALPWHVRADYVLENLAEERVELDVGFPVLGARGGYVQSESEESGEDVFAEGRGLEPFAASFHVRLDGDDLRHRLVHNDCPADQLVASANPGRRCYPDVFLFRVALEAHARTSLTVEYDQAPSQCCNEEGGASDLYAFVDYVLETGALWAGTIGRLDIVYRFAVPPPDGAIIHDKLVGPQLPGQYLYLQESDPTHRQGWLPDVPRTRAPEGVVDLWQPAVRFHYAFACRDGRVVLRLKATDFEPGGTISLGVSNVFVRLDSLHEGDCRRDDTVRAPCAVSRTRAPRASAWSPWERVVWPTGTEEEPIQCRWNHGREEEIAAPPEEWRCSFGDERTEYRYDCCCAAAAEDGGWNPDCDADPRGKGCAAAGGRDVPPSATPPADAGDGPEAGAADVGEGAEAGAAAVPDATGSSDVGSESVPDSTGPAVGDASPGSPSGTSEAASGSGVGTATATPPAATAPATADASPAPAAAPPKKGCGCAAAGSGESGWSGLAVLGGLLLVRLRRRVVDSRTCATTKP